MGGQDMGTQCVWEDGTSVYYRSAEFNFANGTTLRYVNAFLDNYTSVEESCVRTHSPVTPPVNGSIRNISQNCYGPKYHHGILADYVHYGSVSATRYMWSGQYIDIDVDNGCIPVRQSPPAMTFTSFSPYSPPVSREHHFGAPLPEKCLEQ